jgi:PAS domain S-box-containing protein
MYAGLTLKPKTNAIILALVGLLIIVNTLAPSVDVLELTRSNQFTFFLITLLKILIVASYALFVINELVRKDNQLLQKNTKLEDEIKNLKKFNLLTQTYQSLSTLRGTLNYGTLTQLIPMTIGKLLGSDVTLLFLTENENLNYVSSWSKKTEGVVKGAPFTQCSTKHGSSCIIDQLKNLNEFTGKEASEFLKSCTQNCSDALSSYGSKYFVLAPMKVIDQNLGVIVMGFPEKRDFRWDELEVLRIFTSTSVLAIENSRYYSKTREDFERYNAILTELIDAVVVVDKNNKIILFNSQAEKLIGIKAPDAVGNQVREVLFSLEETGKKTPPESTAITKALQTDEVISIPKRFYKKPDGNLVPTTVSAKSIKDDSGTPIGVMLLIRNLSEKIEFERTRNEFISVASRELKTPIVDIKEFVERIREDKTGKMSSRQKNFLELAYKGNERLLRLVDDLLRVSQIDKGNVRVSKRTIDLTEITKTAVEDFIYQAGRKKQTLTYTEPRKPLKIKADPTHVREVLAILLGNAVKYTEGGGEITIHHKADKSTITTFVKDSGPPIEKEVIPNLFKKFYRDPKLATNIEGTGLGLYIVKQLVELMDGKIGVQSNKKIGTIFDFKLPKARRQFANK